jgi:hypothetical protein
MANTARQAITHGSTATRLAADPLVPDGISGDTLVLKNSGTVDCYLGGSDVTTSNGWPFPVAAVLVLDVAEHLYALVQSGNTDGEISVLRAN